MNLRWRSNTRRLGFALISTIAASLFAFCPTLGAAGTGPSYSGTYKDDRISVTLEGTPADNAIHGSVVSHGKTYPLTASVTDGKLRGTFTDNAGNSFPFTATIDGARLTFTTGQSTYHLESNPLDDKAAAAAPGNGAAAGPVPTQAGAPAHGAADFSARMPWLHEGAVLTFTMGVLATNQLLKADRDGGLTDPRSGRHFKPGDRDGTTVSGWTQDTITAVGPERAVVLMNFFADDRVLGAPDPMPQINGLALPSPLAGGAVGDAWIDPQRLATTKNNSIGVLVTPVAWPVGNRTIDAVRLSIVNDRGCTDCVYELKTGLELHYFQCSQTRPPNIVGQLTSNEKNWFATWGDLVSVRDIHVPWSGEAMPDTMQNLKALHYAGTLNVHGPFARPQPYTYDVTRQASGKNWVLTENVTQMQGIPIPTKSPMIYGNTQFGGLWAGPAALGKLQQGQVLDEDPLTRVKTFVKKAGGDSVVISRTNAGSVMDFEYDTHTGLLTGSDTYDGLTRIEYAMKLQSRE